MKNKNIKKIFNNNDKIISNKKEHKFKIKKIKTNIKDHHKKKRKNFIVIILIISLIIILFLAVFFSHFIYNYNYIFKNKYKKKSDFSLSQLSDNLEVNKTLDFETKTFGIMRRKDCRKCGLFSYYSLHLGCILIYLNQGYIPIIDVSSFRNIFNGYNKSSPQNKINPWEAFFYSAFWLYFR